MSRRVASCVLIASALIAHISLHAHSGPPFPIVSNHVSGSYDISIWTDPDATDDGSAAGQFWVVIDGSRREVSIPPGTTATVSIRPLDRAGSTLSAVAAPVDGNVSRQFAALLMDHEGRFAVHLVVDGPLGRAELDAQADATYDERPAPYLMAVYLFPFLALGFIWVKAMRRRRAIKRNSRG